MTTDPFPTAARAEAERRNPPIDRYPDDFTYPRSVLREHKRGEFEVGAKWARTYLAEQEPTDAECLAVLNVAMVPLGEPPMRNGLADWNPAAVERVRAALSAARAAGRDAR